MNAISKSRGFIRKVEHKESTSGGYHRFAVRFDGQDRDQWITYFGALQPFSEDAYVECELKRDKQDRPFLDEYHILKPGRQNTPGPATVATVATGATPSAPSAPSAGAPAGHRDQWIFAECVFQHWIARFDEVGPEQVKSMVAHSLDCALFAQAVFSAQDKEGTSAARKLVLSRVIGTPEERITRLQDSATARDVRRDEPPPPDNGDPGFEPENVGYAGPDDFDDDVPY